MEKEFIPYELAIKIKDLEFKTPCLAHYGKLSKRSQYRLILGLYNSTFNKDGDAFGRIDCPLWQQAFDWFLSEHELISWIDENDNTFRINIQYGFGGSILGIQGFKSVYEARQHCLEKLIKIVETK